MGIIALPIYLYLAFDTRDNDSPLPSIPRDRYRGDLSSPSYLFFTTRRGAS
jgi:hypothetical protein